MKIALIVFILGISHSGICQSTEIGPGEQPQLSVDPNGIVRLVYGQENRIYYSVSIDNGASFSKPTVVAELNDMHLGMTRGPQFASSRDYSIVTAIDKKGNIHSFQLNHKTKTWNKIKNVNDAEGSAPEGLMSVTADEANVFYAVWLDLREDKNNKIAFSTLTKNGSWSTNRIIYKSPDKTVCECCKPSVAVKGKSVSLMFRNWIEGSRDLYVTNSFDGGVTFGNPTKLGNGTWKLKGCPMDGGGILIDKNNIVHTVWQREGVVYYDQQGQSENRIAAGRSCNLFGNETPFMTWQEGGQIFGQSLNGNKISIGAGTSINVVQLKNKMLLAAWEKDGEILYLKLKE
jgi:hypothetical protein